MAITVITTEHENNVTPCGVQMFIAVISMKISHLRGFEFFFMFLLIADTCFNDHEPKDFA